MQKVHVKQNTLFVVLAVVMALLLAACAVPAAQTPGNGSAAVEEVAAAEEGATDTEGAAEESTAETVVVTHPQGETTVAKNPQTVVVFEYSALDTLDQLGVEVAGVPQSSVAPPFLSKYADSDAYANVGTLFEPDYEKVNDLQPDLIIIGGRSSATYPELSKIAPTIDVSVNQANFVEDFKRNMTNLGIIFDKEEEIASALAAIDESIARVQEKAAASDEKALIVMTTGGEVTAYGPGSRFGIIHDLLGIAPVVEDIEAATHGDAISFEFILEYDPDILFVIDRDTATGSATESAQQIMDNELMWETKAWTDDKITYLDPAVWYLANSGLSTVATMISEVEAALE